MLLQIDAAKLQPNLVRETIRQLCLIKSAAWDFICCLMNLTFVSLAESDPIRKYLFQDAKFHASPIVRQKARDFQCLDPKQKEKTAEVVAPKA
jgi:hypothetical protein